MAEHWNCMKCGASTDVPWKSYCSRCFDETAAILERLEECQNEDWCEWFCGIYNNPPCGKCIPHYIKTGSMITEEETK